MTRSRIYLGIGIFLLIWLCLIPSIVLYRNQFLDDLEIFTYASNDNDPIELRAGTTTTLYLAEDTEGYPQHSDVEVRWSIEPSGEVWVDKYGYLTIPDDAPHGAVYTVTARTLLDSISTEIYIYDPDQNPLAGIWYETGQIDCQNGTILPPPSIPLNSLEFKSNGRFTMTWRPFEYQFDYQGGYEFDPESGTFSFVVEREGINRRPPEFDPDGTYEINAQNQLVLHDIWLGTAVAAQRPINVTCGHVFTRRNY